MDNRTLKVLVVDDDRRFRHFTTVALEEAGFQHEVAEDGEQALATLERCAPGTFDLILLDVQMPGVSGWELLLELRERSHEVPVIFVTAVDSKEMRVKALRNGADDYITKPVEYEELIARLEAVVRRRNALPSMNHGDVVMHLAKRRVERDSQQIDLSPREYDLLLALIQARGEVVSRASLLLDIWDMNFDPGTNVVDVHVGRLRKKLNRLGPNLIETVRGEGYRVLAIGS